MTDFSNFLDVQIKTAWGRALTGFASFCDPGPAFCILDIGCGPGLLPAIFARAGHTAFGIDTDFTLLTCSISSNLVQAEALNLPFQPSTFDLVTATNVLFLLDDPLSALNEWRCLLTPAGHLCLLNPSEHLDVPTARRLADERGLNGTARESLLNWARNAESHYRWTETETRDLLSQAGLRLEESALRVGPGFARFVRARLH